jgi:hypothetical protein
MDERIQRDLKLLKAYALISTLVFGTLLVGAFRQQEQKQRFTEIDVERINVVEPDGKLRMVISNRPRSIGPIYKGKPFGYPGGTRPGIIFFNDEGTENGGLTMTGRKNADGTYNSSLHMSFDQFNQDQVMVLNYTDNNGDKRTGVAFGERANVDIFDMVAQMDSINRSIPAGPARAEAMRQFQAPRNGVPLYAERAYLGRNRAKAAVLNLSDFMGRTRLRIMVDSAGTGSLEFLDEQGRVTSRLPDTARR